MIDPGQRSIFDDPPKPQPGHDYDDRAHARTTDPETSHEAAAAVDMPKRQQEIMDALNAFAGGLATMQMVAEHMGIELVCVSPGFAPLRRKGKIIDSGKRWKGPSGRRRIVWRAVA